MLGHEIDVAGVGGTLTGNALAVAAIRATLVHLPAGRGLRGRHPPRRAVHRGRRRGDRRARPALARAAPGLPGGVLVLPAPADGAAAAAAVDEDLEGFLHLWCLNRGVLLTPFHNMALFSPQHTEADVDRHTEVFTEALAALTS